MKNLMLIFLVGFLSATAKAEFASGTGGFDRSYHEFDGIRASDLPKSEKTSATFAYIADVFSNGGKPLSLKGCFDSLDSGFQGKLDPCLPILSRASDGGGGSTGGGGD